MGIGIKVNDDGHPSLNKKRDLIVRMLLPQIDVKREAKLGQFKMVKDCIMWLGEIGRGTNYAIIFRVLLPQIDVKKKLKLRQFKMLRMVSCGLER